jgi:hypothetical protein
MGIIRAINQAENPIGVPSIIPESHSGSILSAESAGRAILRVQGHVRVDRPGPLRWPTSFNGGGGGDAHGVGLHRVERSDPGYEDGVVSDRTGKTGDSFFVRRHTGVPERSQGGTSLTVESKCGFGCSANTLVLGADTRRERQQAQDCPEKKRWNPQ